MKARSTKQIQIEKLNKTLIKKEKKEKERHLSPQIR
jgi:hypothetical protein